MKTNQLTESDKVARFTEAENYASAIWGMDDAIKELLGPRADDEVMKNQMYTQIAQQGYTTLKDLESDIKNKQTLNYIDVFLLGAGILSDLITDDYELLRTKENKKRKVATSEKIDDKNN